MRTNDIKGANSKAGKSITESRRIKLTSSDLSDLISDIENYRKRQLNKNGQINLWPKNKPEGSRKEQNFSLFDNEFGVDSNKHNRETTTPRIMPSIDTIGAERDQPQFRSQPRHGAFSNNNSPNKIIVIKDRILGNNDIEFQKQSSKRQERLSKFYQYNKPLGQPKSLLTDIGKRSFGNININRKIDNLKANHTPFNHPDRIEPIMNRVRPSNSYHNFDGNRQGSPVRMMKAYNSKEVDDIKRTQSSHKNPLGNLTDVKNISHNIDISRNDQMKKNNRSNVLSNIKLNVSDSRKDRNLIGKPFGYKDDAKRVINFHPISNMGANVQGSVSINEQMLNQFVKQRRTEQEKLNKVLG